MVLKEEAVMSHKDTYINTQRSHYKSFHSPVNAITGDFDSLLGITQ